jgi:hypothetical protein
MCLSGCCICCKYFSGWCMCCNGFSSVFHMFFTNVSDACFKFFICLLLYVASIASGYFKSRSGYCTWDARGKRKRRERSLHEHTTRAPVCTRETQAWVGEVRVARALHGCAKRRRGNRLQPRASFRSLGASSADILVDFNIYAHNLIKHIGFFYLNS